MFCLHACRTVNIHLINTLGVQDVAACIECRCPPELELKNGGGVLCCTDCPSQSKQGIIEYAMEYTTIYRLACLLHSGLVLTPGTQPQPLPFKDVIKGAAHFCCLVHGLLFVTAKTLFWQKASAQITSAIVSLCERAWMGLLPTFVVVGHSCSHAC